MKKDRLSCMLRSLRNQRPKTRERFIDRRMSLALQKAADSAWRYRSVVIDGLNVRVGHSPDRFYSTHYDLLWCDFEP